MTIRPSFFVVGAQKSGTTALHHHLVKHPDLFLPQVKETHFFSDGHGEYRKGLQFYLNTHFAGADANQLAGEVDPEYLFFPETPGRLAQYFPQAKLIFLFREPVARAFSQYQHAYRVGEERLDFAHALAREQFRMNMGPEDSDAKAERFLYVPQADNAVEQRRLFQMMARTCFSYVSRGHYAEQVKRYLPLFPRRQMLFLLFESLRDKPEETLRGVYEFLGVSYLAPLPQGAEEKNSAWAPRNRSLQDFLLDPSLAKSFVKHFLPKGIRADIKDWLNNKNRQNVRGQEISPTIRAELAAHFSTHNCELSSLTGLDLTPWGSLAGIEGDHGLATTSTG